jgi:hypothetical protein
MILDCGELKPCMLQIAQRSLQVPEISVCGSSHMDAEPRVTCSDIGDWEHPRGTPFTNAPTCRVRSAFVRAPRPPTPPQKWPHDELRRRILDPSHWIKKAPSRRRLKGDCGSRSAGVRCTPLIGKWASQPPPLSLDMSGAGGEAPASRVLPLASPRSFALP